MTEHAVSQLLLWAGIGYVSGSVPYSLILGNVVLGIDIRHVGDGNPGATNVARAGGKPLGAVAVFLDALKATIPTAIAYWWVGGVNNWFFVVGLAPALGHAFSPFLGGKGGKAIASVAGVWLALLLWEAPVVMAILLIVFTRVIEQDGWSAVLMFFAFGGWIAVRSVLPALSAVALPNQAFFYPLWVSHLLLLLWTHRHELASPPRLKVLS